MDVHPMILIIIVVNSVLTLVTSIGTSIVVLMLLFYSKKADMFMDRMLLTIEQTARVIEYIQRRT